MKVRIIKEIGTWAALRVYWGGGGVSDPSNDVCPNGRRYHDAETALGTTEQIGAWEFGGKPEDYADDRWPVKCDSCGKLVPTDLPVSPPAGTHVDHPEGAECVYRSVLNKQVFHRRLYDSPSGRPEPGDAYWLSYPDHYCAWTNCDGRHLHVVLPNGWDWDVMSRCSNCGSLNDRTHRCWVLHEQPAGIFHVDKNGQTCSAGAGSISAPGWHGFLHGGELTSC